MRVHAVQGCGRQASGLLASCSGRTAGESSSPECCLLAGRAFSRAIDAKTLALEGTNQAKLGKEKPTDWSRLQKNSQLQLLRTKLTVKTTTKAHRFSHHIKADRELEIRSFWRDSRSVQNPAHLQRYINFSRIYARFRDMDYLPHTMRDWDAAIDRLFDHDRGMQPANDLVRKHPYLLNVKIQPLQFAKNAVKGKLPLYDWRLVLRDLRLLVGEDVEGKGNEQAPQQPLQEPFNHAKRTSASAEQ